MSCSVAILFLTYDSIFHWDAFMGKGYQPHHMFVHASQPDAFPPAIRDAVTMIPTQTTEWGDCSIVSASLSLLRTAMQHSNYSFFVLCAQDSYPLLAASKLELRLIANKHSWFSPMPDKFFGATETPLSKSSQWWALSLRDAIVILHSQLEPVRTKIMYEIPPKKACDELFFLSMLQRIIPKYRFRASAIQYVKWFPEWVAKHPTTLNRLLPSDRTGIAAASSAFVRKTTSAFSPEEWTPSSTAVLVVLGMSTPSPLVLPATLTNKRSNEGNQPDVYLLVVAPLKEEWRPLSLQCVQMYSAVWNQLDKAIAYLATQYLPAEGKYTEVTVVKEDGTVQSMRPSSGTGNRPRSRPAPVGGTRRRRRCPKRMKRKNKTNRGLRCCRRRTRRGARSYRMR